MERRDCRRVGATRAVIEGNNRRVDGFVIKVFHARNAVETHSKSKGLDAFAHRKSLKGKEAFRDGRSLRDVVAGQPDKTAVISIPSLENEVKQWQEHSFHKEPYEINPPLSEVDWLKRCLVGQLKGMYNADLVQHALNSDDISCGISVWSGSFVLIRYLAGLWGNVIKVEDETSTKARAWIDVESPTDDPDEDSRSLCNETQDTFNAEPPRNIVGEGEQLFHDELLDPRGEDPNECAGEQELRVCSNINTEIRDQTHFDIEPNIHPGLLSDGDLLDIPVNQMVEPTRASSDVSASETPSFDSGSGLFTVKPKLLKLSNGVHPLNFRSKVDRPQSWAGSFAFASQGRPRTGVSSGCRKNRSYKSRGLSPPLLRLRDTSSCPQSTKLVRNDIDDDLLEARKSVKVCKSVGLSFEANEEIMPRVTFLQESKLQSVEGKLVRYLCGGASDFSFVHPPSEGSSGGIISLWDQNYFGLESSTIHKSYIVLLGCIIPLQFKCALVNIYAPNDNAERLSVFSELRSTLSQLSVPLLLGGDFNIVHTLDEKKGVAVNRSAMATFSNFIENLFLMDPPLHGGAFTWSNLREFPSLGRLDIFLISSDLLLKWPNAIQRLLPKNLSDHNPIAISCCDPNWGPKPFKWFDHWGDDKYIHGIILKKCKEMTGKGIGQTLKSCKFATKQWVQANKYGDLASTSTLEQQQLKLEPELHSGGVIQSKVLDKSVAIKDAIFEHFKKIYNAHPTVPVQRFECHLNTISTEKAYALEYEFNLDDIKTALFSMDGTRAPGLVLSKGTQFDGLLTQMACISQLFFAGC
ncbi:hypothetical protein V6N13_068577 [Hibiscus sabdariffa]